MGSSGLNQPAPVKKTQDLSEPCALPSAAGIICHACQNNEHQACNGRACTVPTFHGSSSEPTLAQLSKRMEDAQARFRICAGKFEHAQEDLETARQNYVEARDEVIAVKKTIREAVEKIEAK